jgi:hypothetical protein
MGIEQMTPREPDRFEAKAKTVCGKDGARLFGLDFEVAVEHVAAALRAAEADALERAARTCVNEKDARAIRALASPAAAPAAPTSTCWSDPQWCAEHGQPFRACAEQGRQAAAPAAHKYDCPATHFDPFREDLCTCRATPSEPVAPAPPLRKECGDNSPEWWTGRWQDWHRGHGCGKDDGKPCTPEGVAEFAAHGRLPGRATPAPAQRAEALLREARRYLLDPWTRQERDALRASIEHYLAARAQGGAGEGKT